MKEKAFVESMDVGEYFSHYMVSLIYLKLSFAL